MSDRDYRAESAQTIAGLNFSLARSHEDAEALRDRIAGLEAEIERLSSVLASWKRLLTRRTENLAARAATAEVRLTEMREGIELAADNLYRIARDCLLATAEGAE